MLAVLVVVVVVGLWDTCQYFVFKLLAVDSVVPALYQISSPALPGVETFQMINSSTDPCGPGTLLSVLTLAYCNVITIKLYIDQGDNGGQRGGSKPHQPINSPLSHLLLLYFLGADHSNSKTLTDKISGDSLIFYISLYSQIVILLNS